MKHFARNLRHNQTDVENLLWRHIRNRQLGGFKFRRQYWIENYIVDFVCVEKRTVIELDGGQHANDTMTENDRQRTGLLESRGFKVLRYWNNEVIHNTQAVLENILTVLQNTTPHPPLSPQRGEGQNIQAPQLGSPIRGQSKQGHDI